MNVSDAGYLTLEGEAITGRMPAQVLLLEGEFTPPVQSAVAHAYRRFCLEAKVSVMEYFNVSRRLADGTLVRFERNGPQDRIFVKAAAVEQGLYELLPAFWLDAPALGSANPSPLNSSTWKELPYDAAALPQVVQNFWLMHPGNHTWFDARPDSAHRDLVLSWWGLSKDRYGMSWAYATTAAELSPEATADRYKTLYCNGIKVGSLPAAIYGVCICEVAGVKNIAVVTAPKFKASENWAGGTPNVTHYRYATSWASLEDFYGAAKPNSELTLTLYHAPLPDAFVSTKVMGLLDFTAIATFTIDSFTPTAFDVDGTPRKFFHSSPGSGCFTAATHPLHFNSSGTQGFLPFAGTASLNDTDASPVTVHGLFMDPRTGAVTTTAGTLTPIDAAIGVALGTATSASAHMPLNLTSGARCLAVDYRGDDLVYAWVDGGGLGTYGATNLDGVLFNEAGSYSEYWYVTGDLRSKCVNFVNRTAGGATDYLRTIRLLNGATITDSIDSAPLAGLNNITLTSWGYEGCDTSFDLRLIVDRAAVFTRVYVDEGDVTATLQALDGFDVQAIQLPVLCGPLQRLDGTPAPATKYVTGDPPP
jgi:hypothetical protein